MTPANDTKVILYSFLIQNIIYFTFVCNDSYPMTKVAIFPLESK